MAFIGMRHVVAAPITTETAGSALVYGTGMVIGKAIQGNVTWDKNDNPLYADDAIAETDNGITGGSIELGLDDLLDDARVLLLGDTAVTVSSSVTEYEQTDDSAPNVGVGYMRVRRKNGSTTYQAVWIHKAQFAEESENAQTKGENIEWQTPTVNGKIMGVVNDSSGKTKYRRRANFTTEADAAAWLDAKANISSGTTVTT